jgi:general secretion pathway protein A
LFTREAIEVVAHYAEGIPRLINQACDRALLVGYARGADRIDEEHAREAIRDLEDGFLGAPRGVRLASRSSDLGTRSVRGA